MCENPLKKGGTKKICNNSSFLEKKNEKKIWGPKKIWEKSKMFEEKKTKKNLGYQKEMRKLQIFWKFEKKSGGTKNTQNSRLQCLVTLGRDKTQRNPD